MKLIFASHNQNKVIEIKKIMPSSIKIISLNEINLGVSEIEETGKTLEENALIKARFVYEKTGENCFADDTGLEVETLNGEPGVYSARYAGPEKSSEKNMFKLLEQLKNKTNRSARFKTVIALILDNKEYLFEGIINGEIIAEKKGDMGFGYDPIFKPNGLEKTLAEMNLSEKNNFSHRAKAIEKLITFLNNK